MRKIQLYENVKGRGRTAKIAPIEGVYTLVDDEDYEKLKDTLWVLRRKGPRNNTEYVRRSAKGGAKPDYMHRIIMGVEDDPSVEIDHKDGNGLNNQKLSNLRIATQSQNTANGKLQNNSTSGFKGVHWHKEACKWMARPKINGKVKHLGLYLDKYEAVFAYNIAVMLLHGGFARPNEIPRENLPGEERKSEIEADVRRRLEKYQFEGTAV